MGEDFPKIESLSTVGTYGKEVITFAETFKTAADQTYRTYSVSTTDQSGNTIKAFLSKLASIQEQVFDDFPVALETYGNTVATYQTALTGLGFNERMWSKLDGGATSLQTLYTGDQATEITNVVSNLNKLLQFSADAAGVDAPDLSGIQSTATEGYSTAGTDRVTLATSVNDAWTTFTKNLTEQAATISAYKSILDTARYIGEYPVSEVFKAIKNGDLEEHEMYYFDAIQSKEDAKALKIILSEDPSSFVEVGQNLSEGMYDVVTDEMTDWMEKGAALGGENRYSKKYDKLFEGFNQGDASGNKIIFEHLLEAGDRRAYNLTVTMMQTYDSNPTNENLSSQTMRNYQKTLDAYNDYLGLFSSAYYLGVGESSWRDNTSSDSYRTFYDSHEKKVTLENFSFDKTDGNADTHRSGGINFSGKDYETKQRLVDYNDGYPIPNGTAWGTKVVVKNDTQAYKSHEVYTQAEAQAAANAAEFQELKAKREKALDDYSKKVVDALTNATLTTINPYLRLTYNVVNGLANKDYNSVYTKSVSALKLPPGTPTNGLNATAKMAIDYIKYTNEIEAIDQALEDNQTNAVSGRNAYLNRGAWILDGINSKGDAKSTTYSGSHYYDFNAILREREMDTYGLKRYILSDSSGDVTYNGQPITTEEEASEFIRNKIRDRVSERNKSEVNIKFDEELVDYMCGDSDKHLSDLSTDQVNMLSTYTSYLGSTGGGSEGYLNYLDDNFEYHYKKEISE